MIVPHLEKVPTGVAALVLTLGLGLGVTGCGGDAESAGDADSTPWAEETNPPTPDAAPSATPPSDAPTSDAPAAADTPARDRTQSPPLQPAPVEPSRPDPELPSPVNPEPEIEEADDALLVPQGTQLTGILESELSTRTSTAGDIFHARLAEALVGAEGEVWIPAGSRLEGRVVESRESPSSEEDAVLVLQIIALEVEGTRFPIQATVVETEVATEARDSGQRTAATIATGAAAGALIGQILGRDTRSTAVGAAVGAAAGTGIALTTRDGHAVLGEGARITVRLDAPVAVAQP